MEEEPRRRSNNKNILLFKDAIEGLRASAVKTGRITQAHESCPTCIAGASGETLDPDDDLRATSFQRLVTACGGRGRRGSTVIGT